MHPCCHLGTGILVLTFAVASVPQGQQMLPLPAHWVKKLDVLDDVALAERRATHDVVLIQFAVSVQETTSRTKHTCHTSNNKHLENKAKR